MAIVTLLSTVITNRDAVPTVLNDNVLSRAALKEAVGFVTTNNGDSATSKYVMCSVPSNARISQIILDTEAQGVGAKVDVGVYRNTKDGGAAVSSNFYAAALDVSAALKASDITNSSGSNTLDKQNMPLWQQLGMSADPMTTLDFAITVNVATAASGKIGLKVKYVD